MARRRTAVHEERLTCIGGDGCGQALTFDPEAPSELLPGRKGRMVGHAEGCVRKAKVLAAQERSVRVWAQADERAREERQRKGQARALARLDDEDDE